MEAIIISFMLVCLFSWCRFVTVLACDKNDWEALLGFKAGISDDPTGALDTWKGKNCCNGWNGVDCDYSTGRVIRLDLQGDRWDDKVYMSGTISESIGNLHFLEMLRLYQWKNITGRIPSSIARLSNLTILDLDGNKLYGTIPAWIGKLSGLEYLTLSANYLSGQIPASIVRLKNVIRIHINKNYLVGHIPMSIGKLDKLADLDLGSNFLSGPIPESSGSFQSLVRLQLQKNMLTGRIPSSLGNLHSVLFISLSKNKLSGGIPSSLGRLHTLQSLHLDGNQLTGQIPHSLGDLSNLISLELSNNKLVGAVPKSFENLPNLAYLDLSRNSLSELLPNLKMTDTPFFLDLSYNNLHLGTIPKWITDSPHIYCLHLAACGIKMRRNEWEPVVPNVYTSIDLSNNEISGDATKFFKQMTELKQVNLSNNHLQYNLSLYSIQGLVSLDLHSNNLYGTVDNVLNSVGHGCGVGGCLKYVDLSENMLSGKISKLMIGQKKLRFLDVSSNSLSGSIPSFIGQLKSIVHLDLSNNSLKGKIPREMLNLKNLKHLNLSYNYLCKEIPQGKPLNEFQTSVYSHNKCLCRQPLHGC
eukprot:Gb_13843 [translate_table: standard]